MYNPVYDARYQKVMDCIAFKNEHVVSTQMGQAVAPSFDELARRLRGRGDTAEDQVLQRLRTARQEYLQADKYDYIVVNDKVDVAAEEILSILTAESLKAYKQTAILKEALSYAVSPDV